MKVYRIYIDISNKNAAEEILLEFNENSQARWHMLELDTDTKEQTRII